VLDQIQIARLVSWINGRPLMKSFHDEGNRSLLKLCRDLCPTQGTGFVLPVLEQVVDTFSMVLVCTTDRVQNVTSLGHPLGRDREHTPASAAK